MAIIVVLHKNGLYQFSTMLSSDRVDQLPTNTHAVWEVTGLESSATIAAVIAHEAGLPPIEATSVRLILGVKR